MKYDITFSCGHTAQIELFGKGADRNRKIAYLEKHGLCADCKKQDAATALEQFERKYNLPELSGSEKQIKWARDLRMDKLQSVIDTIKDRPTPDEIDVDKVIALIVGQAAKMHTESREWIDKRYDLTFYKIIAKEAIDALGGQAAILAAIQ